MNLPVTLRPAHGSLFLHPHRPRNGQSIASELISETRSAPTRCFSANMATPEYQVHYSDGLAPFLPYKRGMYMLLYRLVYMLLYRLRQSRPCLLKISFSHSHLHDKQPQKSCFTASSLAPLLHNHNHNPPTPPLFRVAPWKQFLFIHMWPAAPTSKHAQHFSQLQLLVPAPIAAAAAPILLQ